MFLYNNDFISDTIFAGPEHTFERHLQLMMEQQLANNIPNNTVILDIGANIGLHSLNLASKGFHVHSFEPVPSTFNLLKCSKVANKFDNLIVNNFGLSSEDAILCVTFWLTNRGGNKLNTLDECPEADKVVIKKLDDYVDTVLNGESPYMMKVDVEGYELLAMRGGEKMFKNSPPKLIFSEGTPEWFLQHGHDVKDFFEFFWTYGYTIYRVVESSKSFTKIERVGYEVPIEQFDVVMVHSSIDLIVPSI